MPSDEAIDVRDIDDPAVRSEIDRLAKAVRAEAVKEKAAKGAKDELMEELSTLLAAAELDKCYGEDWSAFWSRGRQFLNKTALLEAGVSVEQLEAGTREGKGFYQVRERKSDV